ncbi:MAG: hypothetical protein HY909_10600 [Deltaproteobacteria bacterium]|nr:hypothetical protein [Deltaproteobacteria bacterium]
MRRSWLFVPLLGALAACGSTAVMPMDTGTSEAGDAAADSLPGDTTTQDSRPGDTGTPPEETAVPPTDTGVPPEDTGTPPEDTGIPPEDTGTPPEDTGIPPTDTGIPPMDTGVPPMDTGVPPMDTGVPPSDAPADTRPVTCTMGGWTDVCPPAAPGPCPNFNDGRPRTVSFTGLRHDVNLSCAGTSTGTGPDAVLPLTLTAPSDVVITGMPTGGDAVLIGLMNGASCARTSELRCSNSSSMAAGGTARVQALSLPAGNYWVVVTSARGFPAIVQATISMPRPRLPGDTCPGVMVMPDSGPQALSLMGFATEADTGTNCGSNGSGGGWADAVFQYTLTAPRDVTVDVSATGSGEVAVDVSAMCGARASAIAACSAGNPTRRVFRNQAAGTYYITAETRVGTTARTLVVNVTTAMPTPTPPADRCPGVALTAATASTADIAGLTPSMTAIPCAGMTPRTDANFSFVGPGMGTDVLVNVATNRGGAALQLRATCDGMAAGPCALSTGGDMGTSIWQRFRALTPGATYTLQASTNATSGNLSARYFTLPAATPAMVMGNLSCMSARTIPSMGGVFTGSTTMADRVASSQCAPGCMGGREVVYRMDLTERRRVIARLDGSYDTLLFFYSGMSCPGTPVMNACSDDVIGNNAQVDITLNPGTYWVFVSGCGPAAVGTYTLDIATLPPG